MTFQVSDFKRNYFLKLLDDEYLPIKPTYTKDGAWLKLLDHSNSLCARVTKAVTKICIYKRLSPEIFPKRKLQLFM